jgi:cytochrome c biogenesis protein CcmG/thiol:disulfide interchange protein DsbE
MDDNSYPTGAAPHALDEAPSEPAVTPASEPAPQPEQPEPRRRRALITFGLIVAGGALLMFAAHRYVSQLGAPSGTAVQGKGIGQPVPDFTAQDIYGNTFNFSDLKGKVVILDFWATWCAPCKVEIPWFLDLYDRYKGQGLEVVGVAMDDEGMSVVKPFAEKLRINYHVVLGNENLATQFGGIVGLPTTFIIGRDGKIVAQHQGLVGRNTFEEAVKKLL